MCTHDFAAVAVSLLAVVPAVGADPPKADAEVAGLIKNLGSPRFAVRETAVQRLVELGPKAKAAVLAGTQDADPEVARRCEVVLPRIQAQERKALVDGSGGWPAPAGERFRDLVGDSKEARTLFAEMTGDDHRAGAADAAAHDPPLGARLYAAEVARLAQADATALRRFQRKLGRAQVGNSGRDASRKAVTPGDVVLALYLGTFPPSPGAPDPADIDGVLAASFIDLANGPQKVPFRKLFAAWLDRRREPRAVAAGLQVALVAGLSEAAPAARRLAADPTVDGPVVALAALVLGHHGTKDDLARLSALRSDVRVCRGAPGTGYEVQVRDVAASMSLALRGQDRRVFRFQVVNVMAEWSGTETCPYTDVGWFGTPAEREEAHKTAWEWLDKQPGAPPKPRK
jgi:hypothetical protein